MHRLIGAGPGLRWPCVAGADPRADRRRGDRESRGHGRAHRIADPRRPIARQRWRRGSLRRPRRASDGGGCRGRRQRRRRSERGRRLDPRLRPDRPDLVVGVPAGGDHARRRDRPVAAEPGGDLRAPGVRRRVRADHPRPAPGVGARRRQVRGRGFRGDHRRHAAGRADRWGRQPVLLCVSRLSSVGRPSS